MANANNGLKQDNKNTVDFYITIVRKMFNSNLLEKIQKDIDNQDSQSESFNEMTIAVNGYITNKYGLKNNIVFVEHKSNELSAVISSFTSVKNDGYVYFNVDSNKKYFLSAGDLICYPSNYTLISDTLDMNYTVKKDFSYGINDDNLMVGDNEYSVVATVTDKYKITLRANSESEAIDKARHTGIARWEHLDLYPELPDTLLFRYGKWGIFEVEK